MELQLKKLTDNIADTSDDVSTTNGINNLLDILCNRLQLKVQTNILLWRNNKTNILHHRRNKHLVKEMHNSKYAYPQKEILFEFKQHKVPLWPYLP